jgi:hypothetical protein
MNQYHYRLVQPNEDHSAAVIEKSGITATFTLAEVQAMQERNKAAKREVAAQLQIERAKLVNIESHHPKVKEMAGIFLTAVALYKESLTYIAQAEPKLAQIDAAIEENAAMVADVIKQLNLKPDAKKTIKNRKG